MSTGNWVVTGMDRPTPVVSRCKMPHCFVSLHHGSLMMHIIGIIPFQNMCSYAITTMRKTASKGQHMLRLEITWRSKKRLRNRRPPLSKTIEGQGQKKAQLRRGNRICPQRD